MSVTTDREGRVVRLVLSDRPTGSGVPGRPAAAALEQVRSYLAGERAEFDLTCRMGLVSEFQRVVVERLVQVPRGRVVTYGELARMAGRPTAARAVGRVMSSNPCPILVPCHRVVAAGGLGGYGPGLDWKRALLRLEGWEFGPGKACRRAALLDDGI